MEGEGNMAIPIIGYILAIFIPIIGIIAGAALFFMKKDVPLYRKHGRYIIYLSIVVWVISVILLLTGVIPR
ncbi:hypothetical protein [Methanobrevibacter sp.]